MPEYLKSSFGYPRISEASFIKPIHAGRAAVAPVPNILPPNVDSSESNPTHTPHAIYGVKPINHASLYSFPVPVFPAHGRSLIPFLNSVFLAVPPGSLATLFSMVIMSEANEGFNTSLFAPSPFN